MRLAICLIWVLLLVGCSEPKKPEQPAPPLQSLNGPPKVQSEPKNEQNSADLSKAEAPPSAPNQAEETRRLLRQQEISAFDYMWLETESRDFPEIKPDIVKALDDGIITKGELRTLEAKIKKLQEDQTGLVESQSRRYWKNQILKKPEE